MEPDGLSIHTSLRRQRKLLASSLILTPVDSLPIYGVPSSDIAFIEGLYATDRRRTDAELSNSKILFGGRRRLIHDTHRIYAAWSRLLRADDATMRVLSGLHAHCLLGMGLGSIGDSVVVLPEIAGGHFATRGILERLGFRVIDLIVDASRRCIDLDESLRVIQASEPKFLFVDRSEGLNYENFAPLVQKASCYTIFDASQYLAGIIAGEFTHPFDMGFDLMISTLHKSIPGPQKAVIATRVKDAHWKKVLDAAGAFVSSTHVRSTYLAGLVIEHADEIAQLFKASVNNALDLEEALIEQGIDCVLTQPGAPATNHLWIRCSSRGDAFRRYRALESCRIHVNHRKLPYGLGYGLRLGTNAATMQGMNAGSVHQIGRQIADLFRDGFSLELKHQVRQSIEDMRRQSVLPHALP